MGVEAEVGTEAGEEAVVQEAGEEVEDGEVEVGVEGAEATCP